MLNPDDVVGAGFTVIADDQEVSDRTQEEINEMFVSLREVLNMYGFDIAIVATQEDAMRFQGRLLLNTMIGKLDELCKS